MARLKIQNVGPISDGLTTGEEFLEFKGVTVFTGNQGSGKSTVAKVFSTMSWIEKALVRGDFSPSSIARYSRFKKQLGYQNIGNYLRKESLIEYQGSAFSISFMDGQVDIQKVESEAQYAFPKVMYVPAERNFVSTVDRPDLVKRLPLPLYTFLDEYEAAKQQLKGAIDLPVGNARFEYLKQNKKSQLLGKNYKIDLLEASSGFQSLVPLVLVSRYLSQLIHQNEETSHKAISVEDEQKIRREIDKIYANENISEDVRRVLLEKLSARFKYASFVNIVEEPEQNLYPSSQKNILLELLKYKNEVEANKLVITTHSPYIVNYLTLAIKAGLVKGKIQESGSSLALLDRLGAVVPLESCVEGNQVNIYQLDDQGKISRLPFPHGIPSDANLLNEFLAESNELYDQLLEIEEEI